MTLLTAESVSKRFSDLIILDVVSFTLTQHDRVALVGRNGAGKTTLLELLSGIQDVDSGKIVRARNCIVDYVQQEKTEYLERSLFEYVAAARNDLILLQSQIEELQNFLEQVPDDKQKLNKLGELQQRYERDGGFTIENEVETILSGLGFEKNRFRQKLGNFSGGEKNRAGLARALTGKGNLLLLDEPTNHLDLESTRWLEDYLLASPRAFVVVSHDRKFLSAIASQVWELSSTGVDFYTGGFDRYMVDRSERRRIAAHHYRHQQQEIARIEDFVQRNMAGQKTKQAQSKLKYLNRLKRLAPPTRDKSSGKINVNSSGRSGLQVLIVKDVSIGYGQKKVITGANFELFRGDKIGLVGRNGSGKSTLIKAVLGELIPQSGDIELGYKVDVSYFDQNLSDLPTSGNVLNALWEVAPSADANQTRSFLARFGYTGDDAFKSVVSLSGGEKTKLCLARMLYHPANLIIMDEPTNHLDLAAREVLEQGLLEYDGTLLVVSHDRYFLDKVTNKTLLLSNGTTTIYSGCYSDVCEQFVEDDIGATKTKPKSDSKQSRLKFKEESRRLSRRKKQMRSIKSQIADGEKELSELEDSLRSDIPSHDWEKLHKLSEQKKSLEQKILELYANLEQLVQIEAERAEDD